MIVYLTPPNGVELQRSISVPAGGEGVAVFENLAFSQGNSALTTESMLLVLSLRALILFPSAVISALSTTLRRRPTVNLFG